MAKGVHRDASRKIEIALAGFGDQPDALTSLEAQSRTIIGVLKRLHGRSVGHCNQASISPSKCCISEENGLSAFAILSDNPTLSPVGHHRIAAGGTCASRVKSLPK
jgi:hypothetical protein